MVNNALLVCFAVICCTQAVLGINVVGKSDWGGRTAASKTVLEMNLKYAVIHHSAGSYCNTTDTCKAQMRNMQHYHMNSLGWDDIGYNFGIGGDGNIYEGRGLGIQGAHAYGWNTKSIGVMFIGNYNDYTPTAAQISKAQELLDYAVSQGQLSTDYILYGHRQVSATKCPGNNLYSEIQNWPHWRALSKNL